MEVREQMLKRIDEINRGIVIGAGLPEDRVPVREMKGSAKAGRPFPFANHNNDFVVELAAIPLGTRINTVAALALLAK